MKLVTFVTATTFGDVQRLGAIDADTVVDLAAAHEARVLLEHGPGEARVADQLVPPSMIGLLRRQQAGLDAAEAAFDFARETGRFSTPLAHVRLRSPLPRPNSLRDFMLVEQHVRDAGLDVPPEWYEIPVYWKGNCDTVIGPGDEVRWPSYTEKLDYELELAAVIGRYGRDVSVQDAPDYIAGYTLLNDWSARDIQMREMKVGLGPGLGKDFASSLGPCLLTDPVDPHGIRMQARVSGDVWSSGTLGAMQFSFAEIVSHISREQPLIPGDVLGGGTVGGGCGLELDRWIQPGDVVELEAEGIGVLANRVVRS